ncbi:hypothetical protein [Nocardia wallacei]|nr:hypothetical protein [Nocardia wallacei]
MEWPWEFVRRRRDERKLSNALLATGMAEDGHITTVPPLVASLMHRPFRPRPAFPDAETALDAIWNEALSLPRWRNAGTTRENASKHLRKSQLYNDSGELSWSGRRWVNRAAKEFERDGEHAAAAAIRDLEHAPRD